MIRTENESEGTIRYDELTDEQYAEAILKATTLGVAVEYGTVRRTGRLYVRLGPDNMTDDLVLEFEQDVFGGV